MFGKVEKKVLINTNLSKVWEYLTNPNLMKQWMGEPEMNIEVLTDWKVGNTIIIKGFHHTDFRNSGKVLQFSFPKILQYSHLSSTSRLRDSPENYSVITFKLTPEKEKTLLKIEVENFPTESIFKHLDFYWCGTIAVLKNFIEKQEKNQ